MVSCLSWFVYADYGRTQQMEAIASSHPVCNCRMLTSITQDPGLHAQFHHQFVDDVQCSCHSITDTPRVHIGSRHAVKADWLSVQR